MERIRNLMLKGFGKGELIKRSLPVFLVVLLLLAFEACKKTVKK